MLKTRRVCVEGILYVPVICEWKWGRRSLWAASDFSLETAHAKISYTLKEAFALDIGQAVNQEWTAAAELLNAGSCVLVECLLNIFSWWDQKKSALVRDSACVRVVGLQQPNWCWWAAGLLWELCGKCEAIASGTELGLKRKGIYFIKLQQWKG